LIPIEINDEVTALRQDGRYVVIGLDGSVAKLQLFADDGQTMERLYWANLISVPVQDLILIGKSHARPAEFKLIP
jgi:hypothetical protein